jgi:hypothetical protein
MHFTAAKLISGFAAIAYAYTQPSGASPLGNPIIHPELGELIPAGTTYDITWTPTTQGALSSSQLEYRPTFFPTNHNPSRQHLPPPPSRTIHQCRSDRNYRRQRRKHRLILLERPVDPRARHNPLRYRTHSRRHRPVPIQPAMRRVEQCCLELCERKCLHGDRHPCYTELYMGFFVLK